MITVTKAVAHPLKTWKFISDFVEPFVPGELYGLEEATKLPRQSLPEAYVTNSCVHVINSRTILEGNSSIGKRVVGLVMARADSINIDELLDFEIAEMIMRQRPQQL